MNGPLFKYFNIQKRVILNNEIIFTLLYATYQFLNQLQSKQYGNTRKLTNLPSLSSATLLHSFRRF